MTFYLFFSLLHLAIIREGHQIAEDYIHGVRVMDSMYLLNLQNNFFQTPLHLAVITKQFKTAEILLKCNVAVDIPDYYGNTALHIACREGNIDIAQIMFQYASNHLMLDLRNYDGRTSNFFYFSLKLFQVSCQLTCSNNCNFNTTGCCSNIACLSILNLKLTIYIKVFVISC